MADPKGNLATPVAYRSDGSIHALELDDNDKLKVAISETIDSRLSDLDRSIQYVNQNLPAGTSVQVAATVPAGEYWQLSTVSFLYSGTVSGVSLRLRVTKGTASMAIYYITPPVSSLPYIFNGNIVLNPGDVVDLVIGGATLNDDIFINVFARRLFTVL